jgi:putative Holliday junction resolvase
MNSMAVRTRCGRDERIDCQMAHAVNSASGKDRIGMDALAFSLEIGSGRLLGLDVGTKTIGLALSDVSRMIATGFETIRRTKFSRDAERLLAVIAEHQVVGLVIGLPINLDGRDGPRAQATRAFARNLAGLVQMPILLWDERMTTLAAERALLEADLSRRRRAEIIDQVAAALILQSALDRLNVAANPDPK